jgi:hypothetical protein
MRLDGLPLLWTDDDHDLLDVRTMHLERIVSDRSGPDSHLLDPPDPPKP